MQNSLSDSNAYRKRLFIFTVLTILALCASAFAGAWVHARFYSQSTLSTQHEQALVSQASRDAAYIRESIGLLADKVGVLQAKVIAVNGLGLRVAQAAGVEYTEPELQASLPFVAYGAFADSSAPGMGGLLDHASVMPMVGSDSVMDFIGDVDVPVVTAEGLGRRLDVLHKQLVAQEDGLALLDLMLTRRTGIDASLPSYSPVDYPYLSSSFGWRRNPVTGRHAMHEGLDFAAPSGAPIYAASSGVVTQARYRTGYGNLVEIMHGNGLSTRYAHASAIKVKEGDLVEKGQTIALVGSTGRSTGAHLHFEVRMAGHPLDPALFLPPQPSSDLFVADAADHITTTDAQVR